MHRRPPTYPLFPYTTLFRSVRGRGHDYPAVPRQHPVGEEQVIGEHRDRKSTRLNSSHLGISYAVFCLKKKTQRDSLFSDDVWCSHYNELLRSLRVDGLMNCD